MPDKSITSSRQLAILLAICFGLNTTTPVLANPVAATGNQSLLNYGLPEAANARQDLLIHSLSQSNAARTQDSSLIPETMYKIGSSPVTLDCALPIHGALPEPLAIPSTKAELKAPVTHKHKTKGPRELTVGLSSDSYETIDQRMNRLVDCALEKNPQMAKLDKAVAHYRTSTQKTVAAGKDIAEYVFDYQGFGPSSEAGDIVLGEKLKVKSRAAAEYARQQLVDSTHSSVTAGTMELAMGLGMSDKTRGSEIANAGYDHLKDMVGEEEAAKTKELIVTLRQDVDIPDSVYNQNIWSTSERQKKQEMLLAGHEQRSCLAGNSKVRAQIQQTQ